MKKSRTCCDCGIKLTFDEIKYYICRCENCEQAYHEELIKAVYGEDE